MIVEIIDASFQKIRSYWKSNFASR